AVLQLEPSGERRDWVFLAPRAGAALGLYSTQRLPAFTDLARHTAPGEIGSRRLEAAAGGLAVALATGGEPWGDLGPLAADLAEGGAAFLDRVEARLRAAPAPLACVAIEVR